MCHKGVAFDAQWVDYFDAHPLLHAKNVLSDAKKATNDCVKACAMFAKEKEVTLEVAQALYRELVECDVDFVTIYRSSGIIDGLWTALEAKDSELMMCISYVLLELVRVSPGFSEVVHGHIHVIVSLLGVSELQVPLFQMLSLAVNERPAIMEDLHRHNFTREVEALFRNTMDAGHMCSLALLLSAVANHAQLMSDASDNEYSVWCDIAKRMLSDKLKVCQSCGISMITDLSKFRVSDTLFDCDVLVTLSNLFGSFVHVPEMFRLLTILCASSPDFAVSFLEDTTILMSLKRYMTQHDRIFEAIPVLTNIATLPNAFAHVVSEYGFLEQILASEYETATNSEKHQILKLFCAVGAHYVQGVSSFDRLTDILTECLDVVSNLTDKDFVILALRTVRNLLDLCIDISTVDDVRQIMDAVILKADTDTELAALAQSIIDDTRI